MYFIHNYAGAVIGSFRLVRDAATAWEQAGKPSHFHITCGAWDTPTHRVPHRHNRCDYAPCVAGHTTFSGDLASGHLTMWRDPWTAPHDATAIATILSSYNPQRRGATPLPAGPLRTAQPLEPIGSLR